MQSQPPELWLTFDKTTKLVATRAAWLKSAERGRKRERQGARLFGETHLKGQNRVGCAPKTEFGFTLGFLSKTRGSKHQYKSGWVSTTIIVI